MSTAYTVDNPNVVSNGPGTHGYVDISVQPSAAQRSARGLPRRVPASLVVLASLLGKYTRGVLMWLGHLSPVDAEDARLLALVFVMAATFVVLCIAVGYGIGAGISAYHLGLGAF